MSFCLRLWYAGGNTSPWLLGHTALNPGCASAGSSGGQVFLLCRPLAMPPYGDSGYLGSACTKGEDTTDPAPLPGLARQTEKRRDHAVRDRQDQRCGEICRRCQAGLPNIPGEQCRVDKPCRADAVHPAGDCRPEWTAPVSSARMWPAARRFTCSSRFPPTGSISLLSESTIRENLKIACPHAIIDEIVRATAWYRSMIPC